MKQKFCDICKKPITIYMPYEKVDDHTYVCKNCINNVPIIYIDDSKMFVPEENKLITISFSKEQVLKLLNNNICPYCNNTIPRIFGLELFCEEGCFFYEVKACNYCGAGISIRIQLLEIEFKEVFKFNRFPIKTFKYKNN